ncbi:hypothetical protein QA649_08915 [Bradyrhizobium sp. CB1717]|uniref:hypothetical protein n=1 Tax=Bradyrhizobium sp. CB1717 TaxID=3039154 RepID=UPI0024B253B2|nr:hypothetical protein [Bradyrhizobium sp. CB1717]WFU26311.1 hypothetical protein QA649_08915 [Bradyrhizobium sp. CB1717]
MERIFHHWYGTFLPDDAEGRHMLQAFADCLSFAGGSVMEKLTGFINGRAPWALPEAEAMAEAAELTASWQDADQMAKRIGLSFADRQLLEVHTIGAVDFTKRQRNAMQKEKRRQRERNRRKAKGAKPHAESINRAEPWKAEGISRRTWFRRREKARGTESCPVSFYVLRGHESVSPSPRSGRDALRAGPKGPRPGGLRRPEQVDRSGIYYGEERSIPWRPEFSGGESHTEPDLPTVRVAFPQAEARA